MDGPARIRGRLPMHAERVPKVTTGRLQTGLPTARLCVGRVMHHRLVPRTHRFAHRVFFVRIPLSAIDRAQNRLFGVNRAAPLSLHYRDFGPRDGTAPQQWIRALLDREGIVADGEVVLHTFPRVFGYVFNPVSFWYCHDAAGCVRAVLAEVNNTFGEHHCYLVAHSDGRPIREGQTLRARKVFHVSPFFDVCGHYQFRFHWSPARVLARVEYWQSNELQALTTSISGRAQPWSEGALLRALCAFPLMTLGVIARIHFEALRLWAKGAVFHRKPAPPSHSLTRSES